MDTKFFSVDVALDFLERVNLINKRLEQERGEKSTFSHQYSSIGLYCGAANHTGPFMACLLRLMGWNCLATLSLGYLCWLVGMLRSDHTGTIAQATAVFTFSVFCFIGTCSGYFVL